MSDLSGQTACDREATSLDGRLCAFHSRQCQALYRGYKKRNAELDLLALPPYLESSKGSIAVQDFTDLKKEAALREVHDYLFRRYNLLDRVIRARRLHHSHFFAIDNDYGHEKYLDQLQNQRYIMAKALERLGKQAAAVMYEQKQWFDWVKQCQEKEEKEGENESKKIKLESLLFRRHQKEIDRHQREIRSKENKKLQEQYLEEVYNQRLSEMSDIEQDEWDPIQDVYGYERDNYVDLIKFFLMLEEHENVDVDAAAAKTVQSDGTSSINPPGKVLSKSAKKRARKANAEVKKMSDPMSQTIDGRGANIIEMETKAEMRDRLRRPVEFERPRGWYVDGSGPSGLHASTPVLPDDEIEQLLGEVAEIKNFLFCRILLSQTTLLAAALEADSIEDFLSKDDVTREHLRDLCLKLERPGLQDVRDACADFIRERDGVEEDDETDNPAEDIVDHAQAGRSSKIGQSFPKHSNAPLEKYQTKREKAAKKSKRAPPEVYSSEGDGIVDFGKVTNEDEYSQKRIRVKVCGRYMYNYRSEKALNRSGWFHFSVIARDSDLFDAVELCRNWNEFFELNILCLYHYFPAPKWTRFIGDLPRQQLLQLGFIPYFHGDKAEKVTHYFQTGSRGMARRSHSIMEMRNFICGHIKRDDPVSRRFIQYLSMETWELRALVRDRKTGRILIQPPREELWLLREKSGWGRATRNEFDVIGEVGPAFFEQMESVAKFHFGFQEYYDVYIWDSDPGRSYFILQRKLEEVLARALRVLELRDMFSASRHILETITRDPNTERVRSIKPDEKAESMWDWLTKNAQAFSWSPTHGNEMEEDFKASYTYTEADGIEDAILFPDEVDGTTVDGLFKYDPNAIEIFETEKIDVRRFAADPDTDDDEPTGSYVDDQELDDEELEALEDDDGDSEWDTEGSDEDDGLEWVLEEENEDMDKAIDILSDRFGQIWKKEPDYFVSILSNPAKAHHIPELVRTIPMNLMHVSRAALRSQKVYGDSHASIENDFYRHIDRQKSKVFKQCFHMADQEPGALSRYAESKLMVQSMDRFVMTNGINTGPFKLCSFMKMASHFREERRIVDDAFQAYAAIALFFETEAFLASEVGVAFKDSKLFDQVERSKHVPDRRTHLSNKTRPEEFWNDWEKLLKDNNRVPGDIVDDIFPLEWRKAIRPIIIRLFRAGIICSSYGRSASGVATAKAEANRPLDLYIDYRKGTPETWKMTEPRDPRQFDRDFIVNMALQFQEQHASAKFSILRLWSSPHFYPLMLGYDRREICAFLDDRGRCWEFKFIPKDMAFSEWSVQQQLSLRLEPYKHILGAHVFVAKDLVLVMGKDEQHLRQLSEGVTWAIQTRPWRLEVDLWRSFVNVDGKFLEGLDRRWLD